MGYYANGYGYFEVKDTSVIGKKIDEIKDEFDPYLDGSIELIAFGLDSAYVKFSYNDQKYHRDEVLAMLDALTPLVVEKSKMEFVGEDNSLWAFVLENGVWVEKNGHVVYE